MAARISAAGNKFGVVLSKEEMESGWPGQGWASKRLGSAKRANPATPDLIQL
jgi:hypothetical protein